jgi:hydroxymethylbilane synthase
MNELSNNALKTQVFSTKKLTDTQLQSFTTSIRVESEDFIKISPNRVSPLVLKTKVKNAIFTSKNAVEGLLTNVSSE